MEDTCRRLSLLPKHKLLEELKFQPARLIVFALEFDELREHVIEYTRSVPPPNGSGKYDGCTWHNECNLPCVDFAGTGCYTCVDRSNVDKFERLGIPYGIKVKHEIPDNAKSFIYIYLRETVVTRDYPSVRTVFIYSPMSPVERFPNADTAFVFRQENLSILYKIPKLDNVILFGTTASNDISDLNITRLRVLDNRGKTLKLPRTLKYYSSSCSVEISNIAELHNLETFCTRGYHKSYMYVTTLPKIRSIDIKTNRFSGRRTMIDDIFKTHTISCKRDAYCSCPLLIDSPTLEEIYLNNVNTDIVIKSPNIKVVYIMTRRGLYSVQIYSENIQTCDLGVSDVFIQANSVAEIHCNRDVRNVHISASEIGILDINTVNLRSPVIVRNVKTLHTWSPETLERCITPEIETIRIYTKLNYVALDHFENLRTAFVDGYYVKTVFVRSDVVVNCVHERHPVNRIIRV